MLESDIELKNSKNDLLNRDKFAEIIAKNISKYNQQKSLTIGIIGHWGSGKTTLINFTINHLPKENHIIIKFDPWFFSNQNNLYLQFFKSIFNSIKQYEHKKYGLFESKIMLKQNLFEKPNKSLENYFNYINGTSIAMNMDDLDFIKNSDNLNSYDSLKFHKDQCEKYFDELNTKIILIIDNIDRLNKKEIVQIFTLVKSLANFKQFIYILSFDKEVVLKALKENNSDFDNKFLDKIIQIPILVPEISESKIDELILTYIKPIYEEHLEKFHSTNNEFNKILDYLKLFIKDIRDIKRYKNILYFYLNEFFYELNIEDFFLILSIQLFNHELFLKIKENENILTIKDEMFKDCDEITYLKDYEKIETIKNKPNFKKFKNLLIYMFPILNAENKIITNKTYNTLKNNHNISTKEHFEKYFTLTLDATEANESLLNRLIQLDNVDDICKILTYSNNKDYNHSLLSKFRDMMERIPKNNIEYFIKALLMSGDKMNLHHTSRHHIKWIFKYLINEITDEYKCYDILRECINYDNNILTVTQSIYSLAFDYGLAGNNKNIKSENEMPIKIYQTEKLINLNIEKIKKCGKNKEFLNQSFLRDILNYWRLLDNKSTVKKYILHNVNTNSKILSFLSKFRTMQKPDTISMEKTSKSEYIFNLEELDKYHGLYFYKNCLNNILYNNPNDKIKEFCEDFLKQLDEHNPKQYRIFISSSWDCKDDYNSVKNWINQNINWKDMSITPSQSNDIYSDSNLNLLIDKQIRNSSLVILLAEMYDTEENKTWINNEIKISQKYRKNILVIKTRKNQVPIKLNEIASKTTKHEETSTILGILELL